jgi:hypothetical protein
MFDFIKCNFNGAKVTIGITGLPIVITGEIVNSGKENIIGIRLEGGNKIFIAADLIAFVF